MILIQSLISSKKRNFMEFQKEVLNQSNLTMRKKIIFLIGGSGLIGKQVEKKLSNKYYKVYNLDIKKSGKNFIYFDCSVTDSIEYLLKNI